MVDNDSASLIRLDKRINGAFDAVLRPPVTPRQALGIACDAVRECYPGIQLGIEWGSSRDHQRAGLWRRLRSVFTGDNPWLGPARKVGIVTVFWPYDLFVKHDPAIHRVFTQAWHACGGPAYLFLFAHIEPAPSRLWS